MANDIVPIQPPTLSQFLNLPKADREDSWDLDDEIQLFRRTVAAADGNTFAQAAALTQIAALERANLKVSDLSQRVISKEELKAIANGYCERLAAIMNQPVDRELQQKLYDAIQRTTNRQSDYED